jgi:flagellar biosynthetic protein FlhB
MSEDAERTQAPSARRRQMAREAGLVPHSPELTAALGLLAGAWLGAAWGEAIVGGLIELIRAGCRGEIGWSGVAGVLMPAAGIVLGTLAVVVGAHLVQTGGLWAPALLAPDVTRLGPRGGEGGLARSLLPLARGLWLGAVTLAVLAWRGPGLGSLAGLTPGELVAACGTVARDLVLALAAAWVAFGLIDFALRHRAFEARLRLTPEEQREEQRVIDGDPAVRSRRLQVARAWLRDPGEMLAGAGLVVTGQAGLSVLLSGGPPPGPVGVRTIARGVAASTLRHAAERAGVPVVKAPDLAGWFARARVGRPALPPELAERLREIWPGRGK